MANKRRKSGTKRAGTRPTASRSRRGHEGAAHPRATKSRAGARARPSGGTRAGAETTTDHDTIRRWAEARGGTPVAVKGTGRGADPGLIRIDFPGYSGGGRFEELSWDEWFEKFDASGLALLYQERTARGQPSNFNKLVARGSAGKRGGGTRSRSR